MKKFMTGLTLSAAVMAVSIFATSAEAHPGVHGEEGVVTGLAHQFTQVDHLSVFLVAAFGLILSGVVLLMQRKNAKAKK